MKIKNKEEYKYIIFLSLIILGISLGEVFRQYIFGEFFLFNKSLLSDIIRANVPTYYHIYDAIAEGGHSGHGKWVLEPVCFLMQIHFLIHLCI